MKRLLLFLSILFATLPAHAHVGSKDVFQAVHAGPYTLYVTVRPPNVIPGIATVEARSTGELISGLRITPLPLTGEASKHPPAADTMRRSPTDPAFYTGAVWMMATGVWQVRLEMDGNAGPRSASVPVVAVPITTLKMNKTMGFTLALLASFLVFSMAAVVAASIREARLRPGEHPNPVLRRKGVAAMAISLVVMGAMVLFGGKWWNVEAADYAENVFAPAATEAALRGNQLDLMVKPYRADSIRRTRSNSDYLPDHGHLMHLYAIREPEMDAVFHLHPTLASAGDFRILLPKMSPGHYRLFGDVVHSTGFPETLLTSLDIPQEMSGVPLGADDAAAFPAPLKDGMLGTRYELPDGYVMVWDAPSLLTAGTAQTFHFRLFDPQGKPATDMQPYLGMAGHAAFVKTDGSVFAHTHPDGSAAMPDMMMAAESTGGMMAATTPEHLAPAVDFPYGFPVPGRYRIFVQMKHGRIVETGAFDAVVN